MIVKVNYLVEGQHFETGYSRFKHALSPECSIRRIEVDWQTEIIAYENGARYYRANATGYFGGHATGKFRVERKQPSRHMSSNLKESFDLPGCLVVNFLDGCLFTWDVLP